MPNNRLHRKVRPYKGYRSKNRYIYYKQMAKYREYLKEYKRVEKYLAKQGLQMRSKAGVYSRSELFTNIKAYREQYGRGDIKFIVRQQAYKYSRKQAIRILEQSRAVENEALKNFSIPKIMIGQDFNIDAEWKKLLYEQGLVNDEGEALSLTAEQRKQKRELAKEFQMEWFGYAS